jgi:hypothetical protein
VTAGLSVRIVSNAGNLRTPTNPPFQNLSVICVPRGSQSKRSTGGTTSTFAIDATETGSWLTHYLIGVNCSSIPGSQRAGITRRREVSLEHTRDADQLCSSREHSHAVFSSQQLRTSPLSNGNDRELIDIC